MSRIKKDEWIIAIRKKTEGLLLEDEKTPFSVIPNTARYWCADPFLFTHEGTTYLFFELYDRIKRKGALGYRILYPNGKYSKIKKCYECATHLSYPHIFYGKDGAIYMMPENSGSKEFYLLKAVAFPDKWEKIVLASEVALADSTVYFGGEETYLWTTKIAQDNVSYLEFYKVGENWEMLPYPQNPVVNDKFGGRMGGNPFVKEGKLIRVAQNSKRTYGGGLVFFEVLSLKESYEERAIKSIDPEQIPVNSKKFRLGLHTYNFDENYEVIDLKRKSVNLVEWLGYALNAFKKVFSRKKK